MTGVSEDDTTLTSIVAFPVPIRRFCLALLALITPVSWPLAHGQSSLGEWKSSQTTVHQKQADPSNAPMPSKYLGRLPAGKVWLPPWSSPPGSRRLGDAKADFVESSPFDIPSEPPKVAIKESSDENGVGSLAQTPIPAASVVSMQIETATSRPTIVTAGTQKKLPSSAPTIAEVPIPRVSELVVSGETSSRPVAVPSAFSELAEPHIPDIGQLNQSLSVEGERKSKKTHRPVVDREIQTVEFTETNIVSESKPPRMMPQRYPEKTSENLEAPLELPPLKSHTEFIAPPIETINTQSSHKTSSPTRIHELPIPAVAPSDGAMQQVNLAQPGVPVPDPSYSQTDVQSVQVPEQQVFESPYFQDEIDCGHEFCGDVCDFQAFDGCDNPRGCHNHDYYLPMEIADGPIVFIAPYLNFGFKGGDRDIGEAELFLPVFQDDYEILFLDARIRGDDDGAVEGNLGLAYRWYLDHGWIMGLYGYYDVLHSENNNTFSQGTIGAELLTLNWDFRVNGYFAESGAQSTNVVATQANGTIVNNNFFERAYGGVDAEIGKRIAYWGMNDRFEIRWFVGGYAFNNNAAGFDSFGGLKSRIEFRIYDLKLFGPQSRLVMGAETSNDDIRDEQLFGFVHLQIPLGSREVLTPLRRRFADRPARYVD